MSLFLNGTVFLVYINAFLILSRISSLSRISPWWQFVLIFLPWSSHCWLHIVLARNSDWSFCLARGYGNSLQKLHFLKKIGGCFYLRERDKNIGLLKDHVIKVGIFFFLCYLIFLTKTIFNR